MPTTKQPIYNVVIADDIDTSGSLLTPEEQMEFAKLAQQLITIPYCPWTPNDGPQTAFLLDFGREALYGGAAGGGKSIALLMAASQFLNVPGYAALLLRKSYQDLGKPGALMDIAEKWWGGKPGVHFNREKHMYTFDCEGGGTSSITFGALDNENDRFKYQGGAYHFVGFDELTQQKERDYRYLFSRVRRVTTGPLSQIPIRVRSTTNPGGVGHEWVFKRFIAAWQNWKLGTGTRRPKRNFHPALLGDNPQLDQEEYMESLEELDPVTRAQLLRGDWNIRPDGRMFSRGKFILIKREDLPGNLQWVRGWDTAGTDPVPGLDPDYTVGTMMARDNRTGFYYIADMRRWRKNPAGNDIGMQLTVDHDTRRVLQVMEQEPGSGGKIAIHHYRIGPFRNSQFKAVPASGKSRGRTSTIAATRTTPLAKILAASPFASHVDANLVHIVVDGSWDHEGLLNEVELFPDGEHDDIVDTCSLATNILDKLPPMDIGAGLTGAEGEPALMQQNVWRPEAMSRRFDELMDTQRMTAPRRGDMGHDELVGPNASSHATEQPDLARSTAAMMAADAFSM